MAKAKEEPKTREQLDAERQDAERQLSADEREDALAAAEEEAAENDANRVESVIDRETGETRDRDWDNDPEPGPHPSGM